ncbi:MAG: hypothetical protein IKR68_05175 [Lachnospiraceae bacterium]|nr:hypothetical protein [Lachnospiraceae bacterium]
MADNFNDYASMSEEDLNYLVAEKQAELSRAMIDLKLARTSLGQMDSREKKAKDSESECLIAYEKAASKVDEIKKAMDAEKAEAIVLMDTVETLKEEQEKAEAQMKDAAGTLGITQAEFDSLESDLDKVNGESALADQELSDANKALDQAKNSYEAKLAEVNDKTRNDREKVLRAEIIEARIKQSDLIETDEDRHIYELQKQRAATDDAVAGKKLDNEIASCVAAKKLGSRVTPVMGAGLNCLMTGDGSFYTYDMGENGIKYTLLDRRPKKRKADVIKDPDQATIDSRTAGKRENIEYQLESRESVFKDVTYNVDAKSVGTMDALDRYADCEGLTFKYGSKTLDSTGGELGFTDSLGNFIGVYVADGISVQGSVTRESVTGSEYSTLASDPGVSDLKGQEVKRGELTLYTDVTSQTMSEDDYRAQVKLFRSKGRQEGIDYVVNSDGSGNYTVISAEIEYDYVPTDITFEAAGVMMAGDTKAKVKELISLNEVTIKASEAMDEAKKQIEVAEEDAAKKKMAAESLSSLKTKLTERKSALDKLNSEYEEGKKSRQLRLTAAEDKLKEHESGITKRNEAMEEAKKAKQEAEEALSEVRATLDMSNAKKSEKEEEIRKIKEDTIPGIVNDLNEIIKASGKSAADLGVSEAELHPQLDVKAPAPKAEPAPAPKAEAPKAEPAKAAEAPKAEAPKPPMTPAAALAADQAARAAQKTAAAAGGNAKAAESAKPAENQSNAATVGQAAEMIKARKNMTPGSKTVLKQAPSDTTGVTEVYGSDGTPETFVIVPTEGAAEDVITVNSGTRFKLDFDTPNIISEDGVGATWNRSKHAKIDAAGYLTLKADRGSSNYKLIIEGSNKGKNYKLTMKVMNLCFTNTLQTMKLDSFMSSVKASLLEVMTYAITELGTAIWAVDDVQLLPGNWTPVSVNGKIIVEAMLHADNKTVEIKRIDGPGNKGKVAVAAWMNGAEYRTTITVTDK